MMRMTHFWPSTVSAAVAAHSASWAASRRAARERGTGEGVWLSPASIRTRTLAPPPTDDQPRSGQPSTVIVMFIVGWISQVML